ncbi:hypothetical protein BRC68_17905 [Halobacteriales archaeon QH_6_64_20]|nr:MAG: hypothetical protein BRC68_17905 [Halobacteriales archaeon QH_6_64_20]
MILSCSREFERTTNRDSSAVSAVPGTTLAISKPITATVTVRPNANWYCTTRRPRLGFAVYLERP